MFINLFFVLSSTREITPTEWVALIVIPILIVGYYYYRYGLKSGFVPTRLQHKERTLKYTSAQSNAAMLKYFPYYQDLDKTQRDYFLKRVEAFMKLKQFIPRQTKPNETVNLLIAATAVQLTFGLDDFSLYSFKKILIYPDTYYSEIRKTYHKGEINVGLKLIVLSAKHFLSGVKDPNDGINLGLHEMAHALNVHAFEEKNHPLINEFIRWSDQAILEMANIEANPNHFLRQYAATNIEEMFAVCTENFFERPVLFNQKSPALYEKMMRLLKQDPRIRTNPLVFKVRH